MCKSSSILHIIRGKFDFFPPPLLLPSLPPINYYIISLIAIVMIIMGFPGGSDGKASVCNVGDPGSIPGSGTSPGEGNGNPLQYSCLENSMYGGAWWATVHGVAKSQTRLSNFTKMIIRADSD